MANDERRYTFSESNKSYVVENLDSIRGDITRSEAVLKIIAYVVQSPDVAKSIIQSDMAFVPPIPRPAEPVPSIETPIV